MSSLFRSLNSFASKRENAVREALVNTLQENAREVQYEIQQSGRDYLELCEATSALCTTLEAILLHGLKETVWQTINVIAGDAERRPEPSFWSPLLVFTHKQVIEQIQSLSQITSEIGQCRAWVRLSINEKLFSSYLNNMRGERVALRPYYKKNALLTDAASMEMAARIMEGIEAQLELQLPVNSSLLNHWPDYALQLSGTWTPPLKSCPISSGVDVAGALPADTLAIPTPQPLSTNQVFSESISNSPFSRSGAFAVQELTQSENLDLFLRKVDEMDPSDEVLNDSMQPKKQAKRVKSKNKKQPHKELDDGKQELPKETETPTHDDCAISTAGTEHSLAESLPGNSLLSQMQRSWSTDAEGDEAAASRYLQRSVSTSSSLHNDRVSYNELLRKHERNNVDWTLVWEKFLLQSPGMSGDQENQDEDEDALEHNSNGSRTNSEFEFMPGSSLEIVELQQMVEQLCQLAREPGLDAQGFLCKSCQHPVGIGNSSYQVCAFSGSYYCDKCMELEPFLIPARIIYNWDFRKYAVCKQAATFLVEFRTQPFIDLLLLNPGIYQASDAMAELQSLRIRLNFIRAYLYACRPASIEPLKLHFLGKEYLYEHIHQYSIADLAMIQRGTLAQQLHKAFKLGEAHILHCARCSLKGFICEICKSARVLYPFHIDTTYRCESCGAVFHAQCLNQQQPCPKCERKKQRENMPLLEENEEEEDKETEEQETQQTLEKIQQHDKLQSREEEQSLVEPKQVEA